MAADELLRPLGQAKPGRRRPRVTLFSVALTLAAAAAGTVFGWVALVKDPLGGEPVAVAAIDKAKPESGASQGAPTGVWGRLAADAADPAPEPPAVAAPAAEARFQDPSRRLTLSPAPDP